MFKRLLNFLNNKVKVELKNTTAIYCPKCGSIRVKHYDYTADTKELVSEMKQVKHFQEYYVRCLDCEAIGIITEVWLSDVEKNEEVGK